MHWFYNKEDNLIRKYKTLKDIPGISQGIASKLKREHMGVPYRKYDYVAANPRLMKEHVRLQRALGNNSVAEKLAGGASVHIEKLIPTNSGLSPDAMGLLDDVATNLMSGKIDKVVSAINTVVSDHAPKGGAFTFHTPYTSKKQELFSLLTPNKNTSNAEKLAAAKAKTTQGIVDVGLAALANVRARDKRKKDAKLKAEQDRIKEEKAELKEAERLADKALKDAEHAEDRRYKLLELEDKRLARESKKVPKPVKPKPKPVTEPADAVQPSDDSYASLQRQIKQLREQLRGGSSVQKNMMEEISEIHEAIDLMKNPPSKMLTKLLDIVNMDSVDSDQVYKIVQKHFNKKFSSQAVLDLINDADTDSSYGYIMSSVTKGIMNKVLPEVRSYLKVDTLSNDVTDMINSLVLYLSKDFR